MYLGAGLSDQEQWEQELSEEYKEGAMPGVHCTELVDILYKPQQRFWAFVEY